jgi:hypothetical protein
MGISAFNHHSYTVQKVGVDRNPPLYLNPLKNRLLEAKNMPNKILPGYYFSITWL